MFGNWYAICIVINAENFDAFNVRAKNFSPLHNDNSFRSPSKTLGSMIRGLKIGVTKWIRKNTDIYKVWQRNYYEHIIRDEDDLNRIRKYIRHNPRNWNNDRLFTDGDHG